MFILKKPMLLLFESLSFCTKYTYTHEVINETYVYID